MFTKILCSLALLLAFPFTGTASAAVEQCPPLVAEFRAKFPKILRQSDYPVIVCVPTFEFKGATILGWWTSDNIVHVGTGQSETDTRTTVAHEVGHAWVAQKPLTHLRDYAKARGLPLDPLIVQEDFAEVFALSLGWWYHIEGSQPPYEFAHAPRPNYLNLLALRAQGLLPEMPPGLPGWLRSDLIDFFGTWGTQFVL